MAPFLFGGRSRVYGDAYVLGHTEYQRIDRMGDADPIRHCRISLRYSVLYYRGRHYCLVELAVLFQETLRQDYSQI